MRWGQRVLIGDRRGPGVQEQHKGRVTPSLRRWVGFVPALLLLLSLAYGGSTAVRTVAAQALTVEIAGFAFAPQTTFIAVGDSIAWHTADGGTHSATSDTAYRGVQRVTM